jgi:hypothetical protein
MDRLASVTGLSFDNLSIAAGRTASDFPKTAAYGRSRGSSNQMKLRQQAGDNWGSVRPLFFIE